ncbi:MAG: 3-oxoacyl-ACP reductase FabG [Infirmifilum sp.]|mgnify:CR=1 FL=1|jgi:3-oxoacyl-[acyl-carrier protein] reductase|uniref:3-oxoacyl-ACP reductase FabG n=1 Tax=Infirmifilum sp. TaxID=2856575 RepID=UPI003D0F4B48
MGWRIRVFTELLTPVEPFKSTYILAIVENEQGERKIARIPSKYFGLVSEGVEGDITEEWTVFGKVTVFIPRLNGYPRRVVLVTGGSRGIGASISLEFAKHGFNVVIADIMRDEEAEKTLEAIRGLGVEAYYVEMDVSKWESVSKGIGEAVKLAGRIDVLVNNAGITRDTYLERMSEDDWNKVLDVNLKGAFLCSKAVYPVMKKQGGGVIINISSIIGILGNPAQANYSASKAGLIGLTKTLAKELAPYGIRVVAIAPGFAKTRMALAVPSPLLQEYLRRIPIPRLVEPEEIAKLVFHVVENEALNGIVIPIDLGTTISSPIA